MAEAVGAEILVNTDVEDAQVAPDVVRLNDGRLLIVWDDEETRTARGQLFGADGAKIGGELSLSERFEQRPQVAAVGDGFVVVTSNNAPSPILVFQRFNGAGAPVGAEVALQARQGALSVFETDVAQLEGGGFVVAWYYNDPSVSGRRLLTQTFDAAGVATSEVRQANATVDSFPTFPSVIALDGGSYEVVWADRPALGGNSEIYGRRYGADGQPASAAPVQLNVTTVRPQDQVAIAQLTGGDRVVVWYDPGSGGVAQAAIVGQRYGVGGEALGGEFTVNTGIAAGQPVIAALANGGFAVVFVGGFDVPGVADSGIFVQEFDAAGAKVGVELTANTSTSGGQGAPSIVDTADGFLVAWQDDGRTGGDTSSSAIRAQLFRSSSAAPAGPTEEDDQLVGTLGPDAVDGLGGADLIEGFEGDDALSGGAGDDWLVGGTGNDTLDPGTGVNVLDGREGVDLANFAPRTAGVWADLAAGAFSDVTTWATYLNLEGLIGTAAADALFGDGAANVLRGCGGGDDLSGRGGEDTLEGGEGDDRLVGGDGADMLRGGTGVDVLAGGAGADVFDLGAACGWDVAADFDAVEDRIGLGGLSFQYLLVYDANGDGALDSQLSYAGGTFVALGVSTLSLEDWNGLTV